jgi:hypothetical protein
MTQIEESQDKCSNAVRQQVTIYDNIKKAQQEELKDYFNKIKLISDLRKENMKLKMHEKDQS